MTSHHSAEDRPPGAVLPAPKPALPGGPGGAGPLPPPPGAAGEGFVAAPPAPGLGREASAVRSDGVMSSGRFACSAADMRGIRAAGAPLAMIAAMTGRRGPSTAAPGVGGCGSFGCASSAGVGTAVGAGVADGGSGCVGGGPPVVRAGAAAGVALAPPAADVVSLAL